MNFVQDYLTEEWQLGQAFKWPNVFWEDDIKKTPFIYGINLE